MAPRRLLTVPEAAEALAVSTRFVYDEIRTGRLRAVKAGNASRATWRIPVEALDEWIASRDDNQAVAS